jgi:hypothetical protein
METSTITITFGDVAENHAQMQKLGKLAEKGFTVEELVQIQSHFQTIGSECELVDLPFPDNDNEKDLGATILVVRKGVDALIGQPSFQVFSELCQLNWDKKAKMKGRVVNKHARWNLCFNEEEQSPDYEKGMGRIVPFSSVPLISILKEKLITIVGEKGKNLVAEGNYYYDSKKCYIGFHGDGERRIVIGTRFGASFPLHYQWYLEGKPRGQRKTVQLDSGDIYFMSDVAVGWNWLKRSVPTLRHAAGFNI